MPGTARTTKARPRGDLLLNGEGAEDIQKHENEQAMPTSAS